MTPIQHVDARLLTRAGIALQTLDRWWTVRPDDHHPTIEQLATLAGVPFRTMQRGIADLDELGMIRIYRDPIHPVGRSIHRTEAMPVVAMPIVEPLTNLARPELAPMPEVAMPEVAALSHATLGMPEVAAHVTLRSKKDYVDVERGDATFGMGEGGPLGGALTRSMARIKTRSGIESNPYQPPSQVVEVMPLLDLKMSQILGRLELALATPEDVAVAASRLAGEFGPAYRPFYVQVCEAVRAGQETIGALQECYEEAHRAGVKNRGAAFIAAIRRTMPKFRRVPTPQANRQASQGVG